MTSLFALLPLLAADPAAYPVGFEVRHAVDHSRTFFDSGAQRGRPIAISIWYPARAASSRPATFRDYVDANLRKDAAGVIVAEERDRVRRQLMEAFSSIPGVDSAVADSMLAVPARATLGAPRRPGRFPLVLFGTALTGPSYLHASLCEYLAGHGYVAAAIPSIPARAGQDLAFDGKAVLLQAEDLRFAFHEMQSHPSVAPGKAALGAWSVGGVATALLAMRNSNIVALVSLDAATGYRYGKELLEASPHYDAGAANAAYLHLTDSMQSLRVPKNFDYLERVARGPAYLVEIPALNHAQFTSLWAVALESTKPSASSSAVKAAYDEVCRVTLAFLDAFVKKGWGG
jgi:dienelactone hydrolase